VIEKETGKTYTSWQRRTAGAKALAPVAGRGGFTDGVLLRWYTLAPPAAELEYGGTGPHQESEHPAQVKQYKN